MPTPAEILTNSKEALTEHSLDLQKQVAVEKTERHRVNKELIGQKGTDFAQLREHPSMVIGSDPCDLEGKFSMRAGPIYQRGFKR